MAKVQLRLAPSLSGMLGTPSSNWLVLEREIPGEATARELLVAFASAERKFGKILLNPDSGDIGDQVDIVLNKRLLSPSELRETRLHDGDVIMLIPPYTGG